jgi:beta-phosphoglucomutase
MLVYSVKQKNYTVIFDMDGVLINTSDNLHAFKTVLPTYGVKLHEIQDPHGQQWRGGSLVGMTHAIQAQFGITIDVDELAYRVDSIHYDRMEKSGVATHPQLRLFLEELLRNKVSIGLGSASRSQRIHTILTRLDILHYFDVIVGADEVKQHKPHPSVYIETAQRLGSSIGDCVVIEDTSAGVEAGKRAGMKVVGFLKFQEQKDVLDRADHIVHDYHELSYELITRLVK